MHIEPHHTEGHSRRPKHLAERFEGMIGVIMVVAIVILAIGLIYGIVTTGDVEPKWMQ